MTTTILCADDFGLTDGVSEAIAKRQALAFPQTGLIPRGHPLALLQNEELIKFLMHPRGGPSQIDGTRAGIEQWLL